MQYTLTEWMLFFFLYCVLGWIWETSYVSVKSRKFVNRGFLYGPWLPIYGSGALIILLSTLRVRDSLPLVYLFGMLGATVLEYLTGAWMEKAFHMRYWDYSKQPLNLNGHICLGVSLAWGCFSLLLVEVVHPPIERLVLKIPATVGEATALVLVVLFTVDVVKSVQAALDLRELLAQITEHNRFLKTAEVRMSQLAEQVSEGSQRFRERIEALEARRAAQEHETESARRAGLFTALERKTSIAMEELSEQLRAAGNEQERTRLQRAYDAASALLTGIQKRRAEAALRKNYRHAASLLRRNPGAVSRGYQGALAELKQRAKARFEGKGE